MPRTATDGLVDLQRRTQLFLNRERQDSLRPEGRNWCKTQWGPVILVGFGGVQAELLKDVRLLPADLTVDGIVRELNLLKGAALFKGFRGSPALDLRALANLIARISGLMLDEPAIREIDLNPVVLYPQGHGIVALDALMWVDELADSGS